MILFVLILIGVLNVHDVELLSNDERTAQTESSIFENLFSSEANLVDLVPNGRVEYLNYSKENDYYIVKCNANYMINSNSSWVKKEQTDKVNAYLTWVPVNGYLNKKLPLCARVCRFQGHLSNGRITIKPSIKLKTKPKPSISMYVELMENSQIKYECVSSYQLKTIKLDEYDTKKSSSSQSPSNRKYFIEKCLPEHSEWRRLKPKRSGNDDYYDDDNINDDREASLEVLISPETTSIITTTTTTTTTTSPKNDLDSNDLTYYHECVKTCKPFKMSKNNLNGFLVPLRETYNPGDQINYLCNDGYLVELPILEANVKNESESSVNSTTRISNMHTLECARNGSWYLLDGSTSSPIGKPITRLPLCSSIKMFPLFNGGQENSGDAKLDMWTYNSFSYAELNLRSVLLIFTIAGILVVILILTLLTRRFYRSRQNDINYQNYLTQIDPLLMASENVNFNISSNDTCTFQISTTTATNQTNNLPVPTGTNNEPTLFGFGSIGSSSSLNQLNTMLTSTTIQNLPSYEEAISQASHTNNNRALTTVSQLATDLITTGHIIRSNPSMLPPRSGLKEENNEPASTSTQPPSYDETLISRPAESELTPEPSSDAQTGAVRSRSSSIRSNLTIRSANPSIRTNISSSIGNASFNLPPSSCSSSLSNRKNSSKTRRHHHHHFQRNVNRHRLRDTGHVSTAVEANSSLSSEPFSVLTTATTASSLTSNRSNASKVALRGSSSLHNDESTVTEPTTSANACCNDEHELLIDNESPLSSSSINNDLNQQN